MPVRPRFVPAMRWDRHYNCPATKRATARSRWFGCPGFHDPAPVVGWVEATTFTVLIPGSNAYADGALATTCLDVDLHLWDGIRAVSAVVFVGVCLGEGLDFLAVSWEPGVAREAIVDIVAKP